MGNRYISLRSWNPFTLWREYRKLSARLKDKNIDGNLKGEGLIQGGVFVFNKEGELLYAYEENVGNELTLDDIQAAIDAVRVGSLDEIDSDARTASVSQNEL